MIDRFINGHVDRISPEGPIPVVAVREFNSIPGGAANVARNVAALGGAITLVGVIGDDSEGAELSGMFRHEDRMRFVPIIDPTRPTAEKTRYVAQGQQLLRVDRERVGAISPDVERAVLARTEELLDDHDILVLSDYGKGVLTDHVVSELIAYARRRGIPVAVDPKSKNFARYAGATVITPNVAEARLATGIDARDDASAAAAGKAIMEQANIDCVLLTRSERGMTIVQRDVEPVHIPTHAREVYDVSGAGDTAVATLALGLAAGKKIEEAVYLANVAAGIVVGKRGTAVVSRSELEAELDQLESSEPALISDKVKSLRNAIEERDNWGKRQLKVGFTNGCFDVLHLGHARILEFAKSQCDRLIVGINSDASVKRLKGETRPVNGESDRAQLLAALSSVDLVVVFEDDTPLALIEALQPDVLVKGADYEIKDIVGADIVQGRGGEVVTFALVPGRSTTAAIARMKAGEAVGS